MLNPGMLVREWNAADADLRAASVQVLSCARIYSSHAESATVAHAKALADLGNAAVDYDFAEHRMEAVRAAYFAATGERQPQEVAP